MSGSTEQYKEDIANKYLENFKSELNVFEKAMIFPINKKMKDILKSDKKINVDNLSDLEDLGFWRKVLGVKIGDNQLFDSLVKKVFNFLKEKQESIIQAEARGGLEELLNSIINGKIDDLSQEVDGDDGDVDRNAADESDGEGTDNGGESSTGETEDNGSDGSTGESDDNEAPEDVPSQGNDNESGGSQSPESSDKPRNPVTAGLERGLGGAAAYRGGISYAERRLGIDVLKNVPEEFDKEQTKRMMKNISNQMQEKLDSGVKMNRAQRKTYEKSIKQFNEAAKSLDSESADAFKARQKLSDRLPPNFLDDLKISRRILNLIDDLPEDELIKIIGKDEKFIVRFFSDKGIAISEDFAKHLKIVKNVGEIKQLTRMARCGTKLSNVIKGIKGMGVITFLFMGFDVWCYVSSKNEAKLVEKINEERSKVLKDQATMQLYIGLGSVLVEALAIAGACIAGCSVTGPVGTAIGVAVGVLAAAASFGYDILYADKKSFYAQNRYEFINQKRTAVKQSILQLLESDRLNMHENMKSDIENDRGIDSDINTMEDAWEALIFQEECMEGNFEMLQRYYGSGEKEEVFLSKLTSEQVDLYRKEKEIMEQLISTRMEYIKNYIKEDKNSPEYKKMKEALENKGGLLYIEQVLADSKVYSYLKQDNEDCYIENYKELSVNEYKDAFKNKLSKEYPQEFLRFEKLRIENPVLFREILTGVESSRFYFQPYIDGDNNLDQIYNSDEISLIKNRINFVSRYHEYIKLGLPIEKTPSLQAHTPSDYNYIESVLLDFDNIEKRPHRNQEGTLKYISSNDYNDRESGIDMEVSNSIFQNVLYSIAKEVHGYTGKNDKIELIAFYAGDGNTTGIYMNSSAKRKINEDWEIDGTINNPDSLNKNDILNKIVTQMELDSPVECADGSLNYEFKRRVIAIVNREFEYSENKKKYEEKIINYINSNVQNKDSGYFELPQNLVIEGKKAGIGDLNKFIFRVENGEIHALCRGDHSENVLNFDKTNQKIYFEATTKLREKYTQEEKNLIGMIDSIESKLLKIRGVEGDDLSHTKQDELDIPVELERILSKKSIERDNIKESILYMQPQAAHDYLEKNANIYYEYFNGIYMGILTRVTGKKNSAFTSNDVDDLSDFFDIMSPIGDKVAYNDNGTIKFGGFVNEKIAGYMERLFNEYRDNNTGKTIKELILSDDITEGALGQDLASELYKLCLEETTFIYNGTRLVDFTIRDMDDKKYKEVKKKMGGVLSGRKFSVVFNEYNNSELASVSRPGFRKIDNGESNVHNQIEAMTKKIIATMNNIDRAGKRKNPQFVANEQQPEAGKVFGTFNSRGYTENIVVEDKGDGALEIKISGMNQTFNIEEGIRIVNLINFIKNNIKENPRGSRGRLIGRLGDYARKDGKLIREVERSLRDYVILEKETVDMYYPSIKDSSEFINYINGFME